VKIRDAPKTRDARSRAWSWVGASLLQEGGKGKGSAWSRNLRGLSGDICALSTDKLVSAETAVGPVCGTSSIASAAR